MEKMAIGVFTSAGAGLGASIERVKSLGVTTVQLHTPPKDRRTQGAAEEIKKSFADAGLDVTLVFCGFAGESYASIQAVKDTVGLVPVTTRAARTAETKEVVKFTSWVGAPGIGIHIGFIPEDTDSANYKDLVETTRGICDACKKVGLTMNLETGQETAETLLSFIRNVQRDNLAVNFDPANMILYGSGEPIAALKRVGQYVKSCHCKDATWSDQPGETWGKETPLGEGQVGIETFVKTLNGLGYTGPLTIEREISGDQQIADIKKAVGLLNDIKAKL